MRYRAFISYSHADSRWARWLHRSIESYRVPSRLRGTQGEFGLLPDRLSPVFRDREDLASAGHLGPRIQSALQDSEALIVICSRSAAASRWVENEILQFKRGANGQRIYCLIVDGEPNGGDERECFPRALRFELGADGELGSEAAEPLAADVRPDKDGKSLARLKLLSGLLGVDLDTLRQREAVRRHRRLTAITALALVLTAVMAYLAVQAVIAQRAAERRQKQAEALVGFMLGDLNDKLSEVSRLDILESVNDQAMEYFQSLPTTDVTDAALEQRAKAFEKIGNVRTEQGHFAQALQAYQAAETLAGRLARTQPSDVARQRAWARQLGYVGTMHWYTGDLDRAQDGFKRAQVVLLRASRLAPADPDLLFELTSVDNNIGHVLESRGRLDEARAQYQRMLADCQRLVKLDPTKSEWLIQEGLAHNNLAKMAILDGDLPGAIAAYRADLAIEKSLAERDPRNNMQAEKLVLTEGALGRTLGLAGDLEGGIAGLRNALAGAERLHRADPQSAFFREDVGLYGYQLARLLRLHGDRDGALAQADQALAALEGLVAQEPGNAGWQRELAEARLERAELAAASGDGPLSLSLSRQAVQALSPLLTQQSEDRSVVLASAAAKLLLARNLGEGAQARQLREQALASVAGQRSGLRDPRLQALRKEAETALVAGTDKPVIKNPP
jgi:tetratricopeptide (TPR) repeat protein